ncbi:acyltransferase [Aeromicrobium sp. Leaf350]|uniref:acyltransferase family protein n=1 Tax=Aeromicrobium sp. Leaf350 TaxID=2876565 RepID=UPI001E413A82|nr:acyltransferase [Aeromicrobium sp. Leaf350]
MTARPTFPGLDTMRAIAAVVVVATHTFFWSGFYSRGTLGVAAHRLEVGVPIFFVLSGFLLAYPYLARLQNGARHDDLGQYAVKRVARIVPVYLVTVVLALALVHQDTGPAVRTWFSNLLMYDYYLSENLPRGLAQMWSLYIEVAFYAALPVLMWLAAVLCGRRWQPRRLLLLLAALTLVNVAWLLADQSLRALPGYLLWFSVGIALAVGHLQLRAATGDPGRSLRVLTALAAAPGICWLMAIAAFALASTPLTGPASLAPRSTGELVMRLVLYAAVAGLIVLPSVLGPTDTRYARAMATPWARHLGHISYSLFCVHIVVLELVAPALGFRLFDSNPLLLFVAVLAISLVAAELLYRLVEKPVMDLVHRRRRSHGARTAPISTSTHA